MSYTQHEWTTGETITAAKLNNIEEGISEAAQSGGGGYDGEVHIKEGFGSGTDGYFIISGTYEHLADLLENNIVPNILVRFFDGDHLRGWSSGLVEMCYWSTSGSVPIIIFKALGSNFSSDVGTWMFYWNANDEVGYYD